MVFDGRDVESASERGAVYRNDQFHRAFRPRARSGVSFGACGGIGCGIVGSVEAPAVVVLGDGSGRRADVRSNDLGPVSLCGRRFGRHGDWDAGIFYWKLGDAAEGGGGARSGAD